MPTSMKLISAPPQPGLIYNARENGFVLPGCGGVSRDCGVETNTMKTLLRMAESDMDTRESTDKDKIDASADIDRKTGQTVEVAEDNLSRHSTKDSSPPVEEQDRTTSRVGND